MGAKQKNEIGKGINGVLDMLCKIAIQNGILINEVKQMRQLLKEHVAAQQSLVKEWMKKDIENHYEKDKKQTEILTSIANGNARKVESV